MCGIAGILVREGEVDPFLGHLDDAMERLVARGPDHGDRVTVGRAALGHRRLAIIDTSPAGNQPMSDDTGRYTITYNGELYNYRELRRRLTDRGVSFSSQSDTEVMLQMFIAFGPAALEDANGFFSFAVYDAVDGKLFLARDRFGIKPLYYRFDGSTFVFASELKSILSFSIDKKIDRTSLFEYLQLSYVPAPNTILKDVRKLEPGCHLTTNGGELSVKRYYRLPGAGEGDAAGTGGVDSYEHAVDRVREVLDDAVRSRLVSDVPLGAFLSGGIDSSVVAALAARHAPQLQTFSVGFRDDEFYDETPDALDAARKMGTNHTAFILTTDDLFGSLHDALDYLDEPFADSSALAVYILSRRTKEHVTVALSGDGADELLGGYNKHYAEYRARRGGAAARLVTAFHPLWRALPASRDTAFANGVRQLRRFSRAARLPAPERYWEWCKFTESDDALEVLADRSVAGGESYRRRVRDATAGIKAHGDLNDVLRADVGLVLPNDMLRKVDLMSMASSLEVRVPYLDHRFVELCFALPVTFKLGSGVRKRILRDAFASMLPESVLTKPKHGFEVPLMRWFRSGLKSLIETDLLADDFVRAQGIFDAAGVAALRSRLFSASPGDVAPLVWALIVFQHWWKKYMS